MSDALPQNFGRYILRERVGQGGMAEVFRASLPGFGGFDKVVAVKRMFHEYASDASFIEMLTDEAKIVSQLAHPNIVQILDVGQIDGDYFIAFEYVEGVDLFRLLQRHHELSRDLPVGMACYAIAELCSALDYAHSRRAMDGTALAIVHRDVSPQNVLLSLIGEVKLTDFGIAKAAYRYTHTQAGMVKGKIYYMSPEQVLGREIDHRSDLFAAGILLYETLCTRPLYDEVDQKALYDKVAAASYAWPADKVGRVPPGLRAVVDQALNPNPDARFQTGRVMRDAILQAAREARQVTDREEAGRYLRAMYDVAENRPTSVVALAPRLAPLGPGGRASAEQQTAAGSLSQERWHSKIEQMPQEPPPMPVHARASRATWQADQAEKPAAAGAPPPIPAQSRQEPDPAATQMAAAGMPPLPVSAPQEVAAPQETQVPEITSRPQTRRPELARSGRVPLPQPGAMVRPPEPIAEPAATAAAWNSEDQATRAGLPPPVSPARPTPRPNLPQPGAPAASPRPMPVNPLPNQPAQPRPMAAVARAPTQANSAPVLAQSAGTPGPRPRPMPGSAPLARPAIEARPGQDARPPVRSPSPAPAGHDDATSMLDQSELDRRLAEARQSAAPSSSHEAATRFVDVAGAELEDTTRPRRRPAPTAAPEPAPQPAVAQPVLQLQERAPPAQLELDPDDAPSGWLLLGLTALVWTGVLVVGLYATLITVRH